MRFKIILILILAGISILVQASSYQPLIPTIANMGPECRIKVGVPINAKFTSNYSGYDDKGDVNPSWANGSAGFTLFRPPYLNDYWSFGFTCLSKNAEIAQSDLLVWDQSTKIWAVNPEKKNLLPDIFPEYRLTIYQVQSVNAQGWAYTTDGTATNYPQRQIYYCIYHGKSAICGDSIVGDVNTIRRHPSADRTGYALKILQSIEFIE